MIFFLYGEDSFRSRQKLNQIVEKFKKSNKSGLSAIEAGMNITFLNMEDEANFGKIKESIETLPFLGKKRLVVIENLLTSNKSSLQKEMTEYIENKKIPENSVVIFWEKGKVDKRKILFKILNKPKASQEFKFLYGYKLDKWIEDSVKEKGGQIDRKAVSKLAAYVGNDLWQMNNEIEKLIAFKDKKIILQEDVDLLVKSKLEIEIFDLIDAIGHKNKKRALKLLHDQITNGKNEVYLLTMITYQFRNILQIKDIAYKVRNNYEIARITKIHPFVAQKTLQQIKNFSKEELKKIYQKLLDADISLKTSNLNPSVVLDVLIDELCK